MAPRFYLCVLLLDFAASSPVCYYEKTESHALYGHNTFVLKQVSLEECRKTCNEKDDQCLSFDYNYNTDSCFLSDKTRNTAPDLFGTHGQLDYFQKVCRDDMPSDYDPHTEPPMPPCDGFSCPNGNCINLSWQCDGDDDCGDMADERNCTAHDGTCGFMCNATANCITADWVCDGDEDCNDGSDEADCGCGDEFECSPNNCINASWVCDDEEDCENGLDEENCPGWIKKEVTLDISVRTNRCTDSHEIDHCTSAVCLFSETRVD